MSRRELSARHESFEQVSPESGELDEAAFDELLEQAPDEALGMLADLVSATDPKLRALAKRLAGRIVVDLARRGRTVRRGIGRLVAQPYRPDGGDLDLDASLESVAIARATGSAVAGEDLRVRGWSRPDTALSLVVDRSGSMGGEPLAAAAVAAAAVAWRAPTDHSVLAFSSQVVVAKGQGTTRPAERVVEDLLVLRGHGTTDLALALRAASAQLSRSAAPRKICVLLSDCRANVPGDVEAAARAHGELWILAPEGEHEEAAALASAVGARFTTLRGPSEVPEAFARLLDG